MLRLNAHVAIAITVVAIVAPCRWVNASPRDPLDEARALLATGDLDRAAQKVTQVIADAPHRGVAHLVLGLVCYRDGRYEDALAEFALARTCAVPALPGPTMFNEGAAWFALDHYDKARASFVEAARIAPNLAFLATVNAAEAALANGEFGVAKMDLAKATRLARTPEREDIVRDLAQRLERESREARARLRESLRGQARAALTEGQSAKAANIYCELLADAEEPALTLAERNLFEHGLGLALLRQARFDDAITHFARAATLDPHDGDSLYMEGLANYRIGADSRARSLLRQALLRGVDKETESLIVSVLDQLSLGGRRAGTGLSAGISAGAGYDSNVLQGMDARPGAISADQVGSAGALLLAGSANLGYRWLLRDSGFVSVDYSLSQLAYPDEDHAASSLQGHTLRLRGEWAPQDGIRLGIALGEELQFSGLRGFGFFQNIVAAEPFVAFDELPYTSTSAGVDVEGKRALDRDYDYASGSRIDAIIRQRLRFPSVHGELAFRHRRERIGVRSVPLLRDPATSKVRKPTPSDQPATANYLYVAPYSYDSNAALASIEVSHGIWHWGADAAVESLRFVGDSILYEIVPNTSRSRLVERQHRSDLRLSGASSVTANVTRTFDCVLRYDVIDNRSSLALAVDDRNFVKHVFTVNVEAQW